MPTARAQQRIRDRDWSRGDALVLPMADTLEALQERANRYEGSIGLVRIAEGAEFRMVPDSPEWSEKQLSIMNQESLFGPSKKPLQKIPWSFRYRFSCADNPECPGHDLQVFDWEPYELYRGQLARWGDGEKAKNDVLHKYNEEFSPVRGNTHLFVGTIIAHATQFPCISVYAPPKA